MISIQTRNAAAKWWRATAATAAGGADLWAAELTALSDSGAVDLERPAALDFWQWSKGLPGWSARPLRWTGGPPPGAGRPRLPGVTVTVRVPADAAALAAARGETIAEMIRAGIEAIRG